MTVIIHPDLGVRGETTRIAKLLLAAADNPADVEYATEGGSGFFVVPDEVATKAGLNPVKAEEKKAKKGKGADNGS